MKHLLSNSILLAAMAAGSVSSANAHVSYNGRNFGDFTDGVYKTLSLGATAAGNYGWADATDSDYGDSHRTRAFKFTLTNATTITITVQGTTANFLPGFSVYSGLAAAETHDTSEDSLNYLASLPDGPYEGSLNALGTWKIAPDRTDAQIPAALSTLTYVGDKADGTSTNYGSAAGIDGDGVADNYVQASFNLGAGDYSIFVGGGNYMSQVGATAPLYGGNYGFTTTVTAVPEPSTYALYAVVFAVGGIYWKFRRKQTVN